MDNIECETCIKRKTIYCPNSAECFDTENKPYYQNRIMLLEENKVLKEKLKMKEILCFNMPKGVDVICLTKADYERNKYEYETYENLKEISEIYKIQKKKVEKT